MRYFKLTNLDKNAKLMTTHLSKVQNYAMWVTRLTWVTKHIIPMEYQEFLMYPFPRKVFEKSILLSDLCPIKIRQSNARVAGWFYHHPTEWTLAALHMNGVALSENNVNICFDPSCSHPWMAAIRIQTPPFPLHCSVDSPRSTPLDKSYEGKVMLFMIDF